jgi:hypothetical protein
MKSAMNLQASNQYCELLDQDAGLKNCHPAVQLMQELSGQAVRFAPTAVDRLEVYKECHRLADDLYRLTGSRLILAHVLKLGDLLLSRILGSQSHSFQADR